jgi:hypothetical protein
MGQWLQPRSRGSHFSMAQRHRKMTFQKEFPALLKKHRIACDERYYGNESSRPFETWT